MSLQTAWLGLYFVVQLAVPVVLMQRIPSEFPGDFSWDMFSHRLECSRVRGVAELANGRRAKLDLVRAFPESFTLRRILYRPRLAEFAGFLCQGLREKYGTDVRLYLDVSCRYTREGPEVQLADPQRDSCAR